MKVTFPLSFTLADPALFAAASAPTAVSPLPVTEAVPRLSAEWITGGTVFDLGIPVSFTGGTSFTGTHATLTLAWPGEINPRTAGRWQGLLTADDTVRVKVYYRLGGAETVLLTGVPSPDGVNEIYGGPGETARIKLEDVTGAASRITGYTVPTAASGAIDAVAAARQALTPIELSVQYGTMAIDHCFGPFPNALAAADEALITRQDRLNPLTGLRRARYGDRQGRIVYFLAQQPESGQPFTPGGPVMGYDFTVRPAAIQRGMEVTRRDVRFTLSRVNPFIQPGSRLALDVPRAGLIETVEVTGVSWRVKPRGESMTVTATRQNIL